MDKNKYLAKYNLINEYYKSRGYIITEEENGFQDPTMGDDMGMGEPTMGGDNGPDMGSNNGPDMGGNQSMGGDMNMDGDMNGMGQNGGTEGFQPQGPEPQDPSMSQAPIGSESDEEVIDVDDLTNAQEDTEKKVERLTNKFDKLLDMISKFEEKIDASNSHIDDLKQEMERRNPTQVEKMSMRSQTGYPFNVSPDAYWSEKEATSNYSREDDENGVNQPQYTITKNDIDGISDWSEISKSLDKEGLFANLKDILDF